MSTAVVQAKLDEGWAPSRCTMRRLAPLLLGLLALAGCTEPSQPEWWFSCRPMAEANVSVPVLDEAVVRREEPPLARALDLCRNQGDATLGGAGAVRADRILGEERAFAWRDAFVSARRVE